MTVYIFIAICVILIGMILKDKSGEEFFKLEVEERIIQSIFLFSVGIVWPLTIIIAMLYFIFTYISKWKKNRNDNNS